MAERRSLQSSLADALKSLLSRGKPVAERQSARVRHDDEDDVADDDLFDAETAEDEDDADAADIETDDEDETPPAAAKPAPKPATRPARPAKPEPVRSNLPVPVAKSGTEVASGFTQLRDRLLERTAGEIELPVPGIGPMNVSRRALFAGAGLGALAVAGLGLTWAFSGQREQPVTLAGAQAFPLGFTWGAVSSAFQIEGWDDLSGRGPSIWDKFEEDPARVASPAKPNIAIGHVDRFAEDVKRLQDIGLKAYSFSLSWPRLFPQGVGEMNEDGFGFYDRLIDALLEAKIEPWCCLHHWDLPEALQQRNGWRNIGMRGWFADYVQAAEGRFGDRIRNWSIAHDPAAVAYYGYGLGTQPPGEASANAYFNALHNMVMSIAGALQALRKTGRGRIGLNVRYTPLMPLGAGDASAVETLDVVLNRAILDPLLLGTYPPTLQAAMQALVTDADRAAMRQSLDFVGVEYLGPAYVQADAGALFRARIADAPPAAKRTAGGTLNDPLAFGKGLQRLARDYGKEVKDFSVMGLGCVVDDPRQGRGGRLDDAERIDYLRSHLDMVYKLIQQQVPIHGVFAYSAFDQIEWTSGFGPSMGLIQVDPETLERKRKASADWFSQVAKSNSIPAARRSQQG